MMVLNDGVRILLPGLCRHAGAWIAWALAGLLRHRADRSASFLLASAGPSA
jgi:hypothetical protein